MTGNPDPEPAVVIVQFLGPISVRVGSRLLGPGDFGGVKPKQIFELLVLARSSMVPKDRIAEALWGDNLPRNPSATIETYVSLLRRSLDPDGDLGKRLIITEREAYRVDPKLIDLDLDRFRGWIEQARFAEGATRRRYLEEALALAGGEVLEDESYADWVEHLRDHYRGLFVEAADGAAELALADDDFAGALQHATRAIEAEPYSEHCYRMAMRALYAQGRRKEALALFETCRAILRSDLDGEPEAETLQLAAAIRKGAELASLTPPSVVPPPSAGDTERERSERTFSVLLVEDNPADARMITEALKVSPSNIEMAVAVDGEQALAMLRNEPPYAPVALPDLVLLDLHLPKLPGAEVLAAIKSVPELRRTPVVVLTQSDTDHDILLCYDLGANGYIVKPSDPGQFETVVNAIESFWPATAKLPPG